MGRAGPAVRSAFRIEPIGWVRADRREAIDGTPVIDIKPVMQGFLPRGLVLEPAWANEIMRSYWKASDD